MVITSIEFFSIVLGAYSVFLILFLLTFNFIEKKIPENHPFKKWWRKYVVTDKIED
jgi:hypothetical protein